ncbi:MAG TPA: hypothetical protein VKB10_01390 [Gaiellaceae bacterium]|nr:hypothetical protein [Gaiellaceae bacterium]
MKQLSKWLFVALLPLLLALVVPAAAGKLTPTRSVPVNGEISGLAFDGPRVVYGVRPYGVASQSVHAWNVLSGNTSVVHRRGGGVAFAVASNRVAWIARGGSPSETDEYLLTTPLPRLHLRQVATAVRHDAHEAGPEIGNWLSGLTGSGNAIAVSSWTTGPGDSMSNGRLSLVGTHGLKPIVSGRDAIVAESLDAGRIAVARSTSLWPSHYRLSGGDGSVAVYSTSGKLLLEVNRGTAKEAALSGNTLAVLTTTNTIQLYDAKTGAFVRSRPVPLRAAHLDLQAGIAIYSVYGKYAGPRALHILQLRTGKDIVLARAVGPYAYAQGDDAQIDELGVVYAVNKRPGTRRSHIVFVPMGRVLTALSKAHVR